MRNKVEDQLFAKVALENFFVQRNQIAECLQYQQSLEKTAKEVPSLSLILLDKGYLTEVQRGVVHRMMATTSPEPQNKNPKKNPPLKTPTPTEEDAGSTHVSKKIMRSPHKKVAPFEKRILAGYELLEVIGQGAMGIVYKARQVSMDRLVALKVLSPELSKNEDFRQRFLREARATAKLNHNNIVAGIDVGEEKGEYYFVMEYIDGFSLLKRLERGGAEDEKQALNIVLQIAKALEHAHKHKMVHRDIKPDNILMTRNAVAKLCDLGLALERGTGSEGEEGKSVGTPNYISPEQALGEPNIDVRSDIYSLGATFFHILTGRPPFQGTPAVVMTKHINEESPDVLELNPHLRESVGQIVDKMLEKDPEDRYQTPAELIEDLERVIEGFAPKHASMDEDAPKIKEISPSKGGKVPPALGKSSKLSNRSSVRRAIRKRRSRF